MAPAITLKDNPREANLFRNRIVFAFAMVVLLFLVLIARLVKLQVFDHIHFQTLSENNRVKIVSIPPTRGLIFDRNGVILAQNTPSFSLEVVPEDVRDLESTIEALRTYLTISDNDEERFLRLVSKSRRFDSVPLRTRLTEQEVARFSVNRHRFPGVDVHARLSRDYPLGSLGVHAIGYVGRISEEELANVDASSYRGTSHFGKTGVEQSYESLLHGRVGFQHVETNAQGRVLRVLKREPPIPGRDIYLSIDTSLQAVAEAAFDGENGALVALDPATGQILAFASMPGYDPNLFVDGIEPKAYHALLNSPQRPLFNRALAGQYPPGSTVKPFIGLAGLSYEALLSHDKVRCPGWFSLKGHSHKYRDWKRGGHGSIDLHDAIAQSCDVYFYEMALELGIDRMHEFMITVGFGQHTQVDLPGENSGLMPSREWKKAARELPWYPGETLITGIGQGFLLSTPLQLAHSTAMLANRGVSIRPRIGAFQKDTTNNQVTTLGEGDSEVSEVQVSHWEAVVEAMIDVVHGPRGTARRIGQGIPYQIAGKTGTAQVFGVAQDKEYDEDEIDKTLRDHALFIGFAPADAPQIAVAVVVENGGGGSRTAAPIARKIFDHYLRGQFRKPADDGLLVTSASQGSSMRESLTTTQILEP